MNPFLLPPTERLVAWKTLRKSLVNLPLEDQLSNVVGFWSHAPTVSIAYDPERPETWPTPWEMMINGEWDRHSIAIGMDFTLRLSGIDSERLRLKMIKDRQKEIMTMVVIIDNKWIINYEYANITKIEDVIFDTILSLKYDGKKFIQTLI